MSTAKRCDGVTRRNFVRVGGLTAFGLGMCNFFQLQRAMAASSLSNSKTAAKPKSCILIWLDGGASHLETFDHKPKLKEWAGKKASEIFSKDDLTGFNPEKTVGKCQILPPVFEFKQHGQCGAWVSEIYPRLATVVDEITFLKGVHTDSAIHSVGEIIWHTGHQRAGFPSMGSWVTYGLGSERSDLPAYVVMKDGVSTAGDQVFQQGMLPGRHQAAVAQVGKSKLPFSNLSPRKGLNPQMQAKQLAALNQLNRLHRDRYPTQPALTGRIEAFEMAYKMQSSATEVFDLSREPKSIHELYGSNQFSKHCLTARRLVENGVRFVEILDGAMGSVFSQMLRKALKTNENQRFYYQVTGLATATQRQSMA